MIKRRESRRNALAYHILHKSDNSASAEITKIENELETLSAILDMEDLAAVPVLRAPTPRHAYTTDPTGPKHRELEIFNKKI